MSEYFGKQTEQNSLQNYRRKIIVDSCVPQQRFHREKGKYK